MGRFLYFDAFNGVSGDMILGSLIDLGLPLDRLRSELGRLGLSGYELSAERVDRQGLRATNFRVHTDQQGHGHRGFTEIRDLVEGSELDPEIRARAVQIFRRLGEAEAGVHGTTLEEVHFHEVGAVDSIVDIVGACIGFRYFEVDHFYTGPLQLGGGSVTFSHGTWPVPTPATAALLGAFPVQMGPVAAELTTPTGAAIVTTLAGSGRPPVCRWEESGLGAGDRTFKEIPNLLRLVLASEAAEDDGPDWQREQVCVLEANIDDMDAEMFGHFMEVALERGALDVYYTPVQMKKSRPAHLLTLLCREQDCRRMAELIFRETTTLGVRWSERRRWALRRETVEVETGQGKVAVKVGRLNGRVISLNPEFEDLKEAAERAGVPLKALKQEVTRKAFELFGDDE